MRGRSSREHPAAWLWWRLVSKLTGHEPQWWHSTSDGSHNMKDPRSIQGWYPKHMSSDERAFLAHLEAHEAAVADPQRAENDPAVISAFFDLIEANERTNEKLRALVTAYRMER